ncbi:MAG: efflux transporter periplasmic adaptor subunit [Sphingomonas bacterium]|nr:efflux RND transporter periplasmic adaptor subunit [Sphingomonas bacterium]MDB5690474.1 efflux transporter periplasmic adaptor subunit [Sphingomonas bacterium]
MSDAGTSSPRNLKAIGIGAAAVALVVVGLGIGSRVHADRQLETVAAENALPSVNVIRAKRSSEGAGLVLPGNIQALNSAALFARTNGYVRRWLVDIGDRVSAGQTMAIIDAPEVEQQLARAQADYQTALANQSLARTTAVRWDTMLAKDAVSKQEADEKRGDLAAKTAIASAQSANVRQLRALHGFTRITAPFAGIVTSRSAQIGGLIVAGNAAAQPLFTVSDVRRLRIYVRVPQGYSSQVQTGMHAKLTVPEYVGRTFDAVLTRSSGAVDPGSGSVLVELQVDNADRALKPGAYAQVTFPLAGANMLTLPASALIVNEAGTAVATVDANSRIRLKPIKIARDEGSVVAIGAGLTGDERIVDTPPDAVANGDRVRVEPTRATQAAKG